MWNTTLRNKLFALVFLTFAAFLPPQAFAAPCGTGVLNCTTDTVGDASIVAAIRDPTVGLRVFNLWLTQCASVWAEAVTTTGHAQRAAYCNKIVAGQVATQTLVALIMSSTVQSEVLSATCPTPAVLGNAAGCMVDADVNFAIAGALAVSGGTTLTTASTFSASTTATQSTVGSNVITVASASGIIQGMVVVGAGVPSASATINPTTVLNISGTSVTLSQPITAALSATPVLFYQSEVNYFSVASATGLSLGQVVTGPGIPPSTVVVGISGTNITVSNNITAPLSATPLAFTAFTGVPTS
jgi:hypothetical protein